MNNLSKLGAPSQITGMDGHPPLRQDLSLLDRIEVSGSWETVPLLKRICSPETQEVADVEDHSTVAKKLRQQLR